MADGIQRHGIECSAVEVVGHQQRGAASRRRGDVTPWWAAADGQDRRIGLQAATGPAQQDATFGRLVQRRHLRSDALHRDALDRRQGAGGLHRIGQKRAIALPWQVAFGIRRFALAAQPGHEGPAVVRQQAQGVGGVVQQEIGAGLWLVGQPRPETAAGLEQGDAPHRAAVNQLQQCRGAGEATADDGHMARAGR